MSQVEQKPHANRYESFKSKLDVVGGRKASAVALLAAITLSACGTASAEGGNPPKPTQTSISAEKTTASVSAEKTTPAMSESETKSATYIETLNPSQQAVREGLAPDKLAKMSDEQISAAFTIPAAEVIVGTDGQIDPKLYAEAFVARSEGSLNLGCSQTEYNKWGGVNTMTTSAHEISLKYVPITSAALLGHKTADIEPNQDVLLSCMIVDSLLAQKPSLATSGLERFHARFTLDPTSAEAVIEANNTTTVKFESTLTDNWDSQIMLENVGGIAKPATDTIYAYTVIGLHITPEGSVLPTAVNFVQ